MGLSVAIDRILARSSSYVDLIANKKFSRLVVWQDRKVTDFQ